MRNAVEEIRHLGLTCSPAAYIISELSRGMSDFPKGDPLKAAKAICEDFGLEIAPEILLSAAKSGTDLSRK
jgi:hypothetical protein